MHVYGFEKPFTFFDREQPIPENPRPQEVLVKVSHVGLCGSDLHLYKGTYSGPQAYPILFGHEWAGEVVRCGKDVQGLHPGMVVTGDCSRYCGECEFCAQDKNLCASIEKFGITVDGASAQYILRDAKYIYPAPEGIDRALLSLSEPIAVALHHIKKVASAAGAAGGLEGKRILVYGGGAIGQACVLLLKRHFGVERVDFFDIIPHRCEVAAQLGANVVSEEQLAPPQSDSYYDMYNATIYDVVLETTGVAQVFVNALRLLRPLGVLGSLGMMPEVALPQKLVVTKSLCIVGSIGGTGEFHEVIPFICQNEKALSLIAGHVFPIAQLQEAFQIALQPGQAIKVILAMGT